MNQIIAIAFGGSFGAVLRFLVSSGIYQWLGREFPYGTLVVNVIGSFLLGLLTEALIIHRIAIAYDYRAAILVGFIGAFTTFSTFSLETVFLLEQGSYFKAFSNIIGSVTACLLAVWLGLFASRALFYWSEGAVVWQGHAIPYALIIINLIGSFLIGFFTVVLYNKTTLEDPHAAAISVLVSGVFLALSGLYIVLFLIDQKYSFTSHFFPLAAAFTGNTLLCLMFIWLGYLAGKDI
jgi:fluoride exporter